MKTSSIQKADWQGVFSVPPLARHRDAARSINWEASARIAAHIHKGGVTRLLYGGNAFLYHITLAEFEALLDWLSSFDDNLWAIPSAGPSFGRLLDQAPLLRRYKFPTVMHLPCGDPRDAKGLEAGLTDFANASGLPLILYLKEENNFGADKLAGLDAVARMVDRGLCVGIKYAVVRQNPADDPYLTALLARVDKSLVISGIGERPAIVHMHQFGLPGYTTGSGCIGSAWTQQMFELCQKGEWEAAAAIRERFIPLEDIRDSLGPARVLHAATTAAGIADAGAIPPFITELTSEQSAALPGAVESLQF
ncbi:MAG: dihydrodipicolinate synthase family protein [Acidobacteria bacterium]|jgi:dihydrodipicolinate synthase/N-acetylneuraminate lyase|nr:dihydrodipicolinate synthase family protein [Bryobacteraceae bacterium CoA2 C42]